MSSKTAEEADNNYRERLSSTQEEGEIIEIVDESSIEKAKNSEDQP